MFDYFAYNWYHVSMKPDNYGDDAELINACVRKDEQAWAHFLARYSGLMLTAIGNRLRKYSIVFKTEDVRDIHQSVLALLWESGKLADIRDMRSMRYWLAVVSGNMAMEYARKKRLYDKVKTVSIFDKLDEMDLADTLPSTAHTPFEEMARAEDAARINEAIESLPVKERLIFKMNVLHNKKYAEIADMLGLPAGTVSTYIKRAKEKLKKYLKYFAIFLGFFTSYIVGG